MRYDVPDEEWIALGPPLGVTDANRQRLAMLADQLGTSDRPEVLERSITALDELDDLVLKSCLSVLIDLVAQGWSVCVDHGQILIRPPTVNPDSTEEKRRVRQLELWKRDEQLRKPSVHSFVRKMESPRIHNGRFTSIFDLMRDGNDLVMSIQAASTAKDREAALAECMTPYVQIVEPSSRCTHTGLRLMDVWRYFRHTWITQYNSTPGRTMRLLVRDASAENHPIIGIAALASPIIQLSVRDTWIGWQPESYLEFLERRATLEHARWLVSKLDTTLAELYVDDLIADGLYWPSLWFQPEPTEIERLRTESKRCRTNHIRFARSQEHRIARSDPDRWRTRSKTDLFRSKRCAVLADLLAARAALLPHITPGPSEAGLRAAMVDRPARRAILGVIRRAKAASVGSAMADLSVCGAVAPYNALLGGKLVSMLSVSPFVVRAYKAKYESSPSEIASSMAGRPIYRSADLVYIGTTSLFGSGSSQYNRIRLPAEILSGATGSLEYTRLGRSRSYGTSHLSSRSISYLVNLSELRAGGSRINSLFGEGSNPKLRKMREGIDCLGWPSDKLLRHGRTRLVYGVSLVQNLLPYLLGVEHEASYLFDVDNLTDTDEIVRYWTTRWLSPRSQRSEVLDVVARHRRSHPNSHGAKVSLPSVSPEQGQS